jgi:hypothetical protein
MSFFEELKLQVADVVLNNIEAPNWVFQVIMLVIGLGFPLVLIFAWAFEMTPEGLKREKDVVRDDSITHVTGRKLDFTIIGVLAVALGYFIWESRFAVPGTDPQTVSAESSVTTSEVTAEAASVDHSIAVLPFADMSPDNDQEYFTDGLSEELSYLIIPVQRSNR